MISLCARPCTPSPLRAEQVMVPGGVQVLQNRRAHGDMLLKTMNAGALGTQKWEGPSSGV